MRQLGIFNNEQEAERFAAWLVAQRIDAQAEEAGESQWAVWVRDEDQLSQAREALAHFRANPQDARYANAERDAAELRRRDEVQRRDAQKNVVQMRTRWGNPAAGMGMGMGMSPRRCPLTLAMIVAALLVSILTGFGEQKGGLVNSLWFVDPARALMADSPRAVMWVSVLRGEIWRLVTPIFIHGDWIHLVMNVLVLYSFGGQIENRRGTWFVAGLALVLAITSNFGQAVEATVRGHLSLFGGLSGVGYGLFGYLLVKTRYDNRDGYLLSPVTSFILLLFFFLCIGGAFPPLNAILPESLTRVANSAHAVGLVVGAALAYAPLVRRKMA